jgi:hypothetical protein
VQAQDSAPQVTGEKIVNRTALIKTPPLTMVVLAEVCEAQQPGLQKHDDKNYHLIGLTLHRNSTR